MAPTKIIGGGGVSGSILWCLPHFKMKLDEQHATEVMARHLQDLASEEQVSPSLTR